MRSKRGSEGKEERVRGKKRGGREKKDGGKKAEWDRKHEKMKVNEENGVHGGRSEEKNEKEEEKEKIRRIYLASKIFVFLFISS